MQGKPRIWSIVGLLALGFAHADPHPQAPAAVNAGAKTWLGRHTEIETFIREAKTQGKPAAIPVGITGPKKITLEPGGPVDFIAWKPLPPGLYEGVRESYKSEIAAYEIDKLLALDMVPPTVERRIDGKVGAAIMWVSGTKTFAELGGAPTAPSAEAERWERQLVRAMMFDNLIGNEDPNLGNWLKDANWNLILIDHSRALSSTKALVHKMNNIDRALWDRMRALDEPTLSAAVERWLSKSETRAILQRRDKMQEAIVKLVKEKGEANVFLGEPRPRSQLRLIFTATDHHRTSSRSARVRYAVFTALPTQPRCRLETLENTMTLLPALPNRRDAERGSRNFRTPAAASESVGLLLTQDRFVR